MDNSFFILAEKSTPIEIKRFHVCSWEFKDNSALMEFGCEIDATNCPETRTLKLEMLIPWLQKSGNSVDLYEKIRDPLNSKFIFNDSVQNTEYLEGASHNSGVIHTFYGRGKLCFLPLRISKDPEKKILTIEVDLFSFTAQASGRKPNIYIRFYLEPELSSISTRKTGISKSTIIYDIKINEKRNLPDHLSTELRTKDLCKISSCFCFNIVPNNHELTFLDSASLKNVRTLEYNSFRKYLGDKRVKDNDLVVVFNKKDAAESYAFFSIYYKERIGAGQFSFAILINILTGILLYLPSLRTNSSSSMFSRAFLASIPMELYVAIGIGASTFLYFFGPIGFVFLNNVLKKVGIKK